MSQATGSGRTSPSGLDERFRRDPKSLMQTPDHFQRERSLAVQHFMDSIPAADIRDQVARLQRVLVHMILDRFDRVRKVQRVVLALEGLHQRSKHVNAITFWSI